MEDNNRNLGIEATLKSIGQKLDVICNRREIDKPRRDVLSGSILSEPAQTQEETQEAVRATLELMAEQMERVELEESSGYEVTTVCEPPQL